jgi:hypothetical protein
MISWPKINFFRRLVGIAVALSLCLLAGCIEKTTHGSETVYSYSLWTGAPLALMGLSSVAVALFILHVDSRIVLLCMCLGSALVIFSSPGIYTDTVVVDDDHFVASYGTFFDPTVQDIRFDDVAEMKFVAEVYSSRRGPRYNGRYKLFCTMKSGDSYIVRVGEPEELTMQAIPEILAKARGKGITVIKQGRMPRGL